MTVDPAAVVLGLTAFGVSLLTLFSGFGLGTLLMPVFALFFPVEVAVASTAVVHAANNLFKVGLLGRSAPRDILIRLIRESCASSKRSFDSERLSMSSMKAPSDSTVLSVWQAIYAVM